MCRWLQKLTPPVFFDLLELQRSDGMACAPRPAPEPDRCALLREMAEEILAQNPCLTRKELAVNGRDALAAGLSGPEIGRALDRLLDRVAAGDLPNDRSVLLPLLGRDLTGE